MANILDQKTAEHQKRGVIKSLSLNMRQTHDLTETELRELKVHLDAFDSMVDGVIAHWVAVGRDMGLDIELSVGASYETDTNPDTEWDFREARGVLRKNNEPVTEKAAEAISRIRRQRSAEETTDGK